MSQYSAFFISIVALAVLWGTGNQPAIIASSIVLALATIFSITGFAFAAKAARVRSQKVAAGMKLRGVPAKEVRQARRKAMKISGSDYDLIPAWVTYSGMILALASVLILAFALVVRFLR
ncbi:MAG: hypothetical protein HKN43_10745 [Rhodothermales bacterium]|nr:hypothetical protein [Rhodothermales bacterium]